MGGHVLLQGVGPGYPALQVYSLQLSIQGSPNMIHRSFEIKNRLVVEVREEMGVEE